MYTKLFRSNIKKSLRDYALYFLTLVISSTLFFAFLSLTSKYNDILDGTGNYSLILFQNIIRYTVLAVSIIFVVLIWYINNYMLRQRSREFSVYLILGMEQGTVAKQFFGETLVFGIAAVITGCITGTVLSGVMTAFVMRTIVGTVQFHFGFYPDTVLATLLFFLPSFVLVGAWNARRIYKLKLIDLLNEKKQSEGAQRKKVYYVLSFIVAVLCFTVVGVALYDFTHSIGIYAGDVPFEISNRYQAVAVMAAIIGIFALYNAFAFVLSVIRSRNKWKNKNINSVLLGNLFQKVSSTANVLSISTLAITVSLVAFAILPISAEISMGYLDYRMPYDLMINNTYRYIDRLEDIPQIDYSFVKEIVEGHNIGITEEVSQESYFVWERDFNTVGTRANWRDLPRLAMRISDYNAMRQMAGFESVPLDDNQFFMHIDYEMDMESTVTGIDSIDSRYIRLDDGTTLQLAETAVYNDRLGTYLFNMDSTVLIFSDSVCDNLILARTSYFANTDTIIPYDLCDNIHGEIESVFQNKYSYLSEKYETKYHSDKNYVSFIDPIRFWTQESSDTMLTATGLRLLGIYAGVIFFIICMTVLTLHMITDSFDQHMQYKTLHQMGVEKDEIVKMEGRQSFIYFFAPCIAAFLIALLMIYSFALRYGYKIFTYVGSVGFQFGVLIPSILVVIILACYYGVTIYTIKRSLVHILNSI